MYISSSSTFELFGIGSFTSSYTTSEVIFEQKFTRL
ncbi:unnamed protein product [Schistosoma curassoni]|uniref:Uncharacterized protein n=1 Tax=Schistosoma curassoni TaxID=6186 RepID=A0A183JU07_9TREM|nr:unnamed protein product [Schistosoma curassoni]